MERIAAPDAACLSRATFLRILLVAGRSPSHGLMNPSTAWHGKHTLLQHASLPRTVPPPARHAVNRASLRAQSFTAFTWEASVYFKSLTGAQTILTWSNAAGTYGMTLSKTASHAYQFAVVHSTGTVTATSVSTLLARTWYSPPLPAHGPSPPSPHSRHVSPRHRPSPANLLLTAAADLAAPPAGTTWQLPTTEGPQGTYASRTPTPGGHPSPRPTVTMQSAWSEVSTAP